MRLPLAKLLARLTLGSPNCNLSRRLRFPVVVFRSIKRPLPALDEPQRNSRQIRAGHGPFPFKLPSQRCPVPRSSSLEKITLAEQTGKLSATSLARLNRLSVLPLLMLSTRVARGDTGYLSAKDKYLFGSPDVTRPRNEFRKHGSDLLRVLSFSFSFFRSRPRRSARWFSNVQSGRKLTLPLVAEYPISLSLS